MFKSKRAISIDGKLYDSLKTAAETFGFNKQSLYQALHRSAGTFKGHQVCYSIKTVEQILNDQQPKQKYDEETLRQFRLENLARGREKAKAEGKLFGARACPVKCVTTGKVYNSISSAAKEIGIHMWTMSIKMESTGKFIDKNGNEYVRLKPMVSKTGRVYPCNSSTIDRVITRKSTHQKLENPIEKISVSQEELITQSLLKSANLLATSKKYVQAANIFNILASLQDK